MNENRRTSAYLHTKNYRVRRKAAGLPPFKSGPSGKHRSKIADYLLRPFVAIDSEGMNYHALSAYELLDAWQTSDPDVESYLGSFSELLNTPFFGGNRRFRHHRTFLWGAASAEDGPCWLSSNGKTPLGSAAILDWLCNLRDRFGRRAIFVAFAFGYDAAQILCDAPYEVLAELQGKSGERQGRYTVWNGYAMRYLKGKYFSVARMLPGDMWRLKQSGLGRVLNKGPVTHIYDVWAFFQHSFLRAFAGVPGAATPEEAALIEEGKRDRLDFSLHDIERVKRYTAAELRVLSRMMAYMRQSLDDAGLRLTRWSGAGSVASAAMSKYQVKEHYPVMSVAESTLPLHQTWAHHAFFGGRIELVQYGFRRGALYGYDIASAYPHAQHNLPSMRGCSWRMHDERPASIEGLSPLSLCEVAWTGETSFPFGPFPYRTRQGAVYYPSIGRGIYCVEEVRAAMRAAKSGVLPYDITVLRVLEAVQGPETTAPFSWMLDYYARRQELVRANKAGAPYSLLEKVYKLALNASYGKTAQKVGGSPKAPPATANPWYAAVITARVRARMLEAALLDPGAVVMFATDGLLATRPLPLSLTTVKELGGWEMGTHAGGIFVQSGVYFYLEDDGRWDQGKTRGIRISGVDEPLYDVILRGWRRGDETISYGYEQYITAGTAARGPTWARVIGNWMAGTRKLDLHGGGTKRREIPGASRKQVAKELVGTFPALPTWNPAMLSAPRMPEWVERDVSEDVQAIDESMQIASSKYGID